MKKSPLSDFFLIFKQRSRNHHNGSVLDTDPVGLRRLPMVPQPDKPRPFLLVIISVIICAVSVYLFVGSQGVRRENKTLLEEVQKNKDLISETQKERNELKNNLEKIKEENASLQILAKKSEETAGSATEEKKYLEEMLINKSKEIEDLKNQALVPAAAPLSAAAGDVERRLAQKDTELKRLYEQNRILSQKLEKLYKTTNEKIAEINLAKITLEETIAQARKAIDNEWNLVDLGSISVNPNSPQKPGKPESRKFSKKEGKVLALNQDHGFVIVDLGKVDGIKNDTTLSLNQNGQTIGKLKILEIRDVMTACNIQELSSGKKIQINDPVLIQK